MGLFQFFSSLFQGQHRAKEIALRYGLEKQVVIDGYYEFQQFAASHGVPATLRGFEIMLRQELSQTNPDVKYIEPLYCKGMDPLAPYNPNDEH